MDRHHSYHLTVIWTGNDGVGTRDYRSYQRNHTIRIGGKPELLCSSDPHFRGDKTRHNPEELFLASIASCHMLWYLHLCAQTGITVVDYKDEATGIMVEDADGKGHFKEVILHPVTTISDPAQEGQAISLHEAANKFCFIANSCNFPIRHKPLCRIAETS